MVSSHAISRVIAAAFNRWIGYGLLALGAALVAFGVYMGLFAWANDGPRAGAGVFGVSAAFGSAVALTGLAFRFAAGMHAKAAPRRWWYQVLPILAGYLAFGLAATASSMLERALR